MKFFWSALMGVFLFSAAQARDLGQWDDTDPELRDWYRALRQPDNPQASCCGESDAYFCSEPYVRDGATYCTITDDRPDEPRRRPHIPVGTEIMIPPNKFGPGKWGNPTGSSVVFLSASRTVYCFVQQAGT